MAVTRTWCRFWLLPVLLAGGACRERSPAIVSSGVAVRAWPAQVTLTAGDEQQLAAEVDDAAGRAVGGAPLTFRSRNPQVASVSARGLVYAVGPRGATEVVVESGGLRCLVPVRVVADPDGGTAAPEPATPSR